MYVCNRSFHAVFWLSWAALAVLTACSQASEPTTEPVTKQEQQGDLLQNVPPTQKLESVEVDSDQMPPLDLNKWTAEGCPKIESQLGQIIQGPNPLETAKQLGIRVQGSKVQVLVILKDEETTFLKDFDVKVGKQSGTQVQAFAPLSRLCELAGTDKVVAIRLPSQAVGP